MKTIVSLFMIFSLIGSSLYSEEPPVADDEPKYTEEISYGDESSYLGFSPDDSVQESIATSMIGWGVGMALAIGVAAAVIKSSTGSSSAHSN